MRMIEKVWFTSYWAKWPLIILLLPLTLIFWGLSHLRRYFYRCGVFKSFKVSAPVIVVGNIGVGGNGKTPVVVSLIERCQKQSIKVGVISRGYGGNAPQYPYLVTKQSTPVEAGDEALLIYQRCQVPIMLGSDRVASAQALIDLGCELLITDDGLQHYRLARQVEIIVVDNKRRFGNGFLLPSGPLREGKWRLSTVNHVIYNMASPLPEGSVDNAQNTVQEIPSKNHIAMYLAPENICNMVTGEVISLVEFYKKYPKVNAVAGIGDPNRFFTTLKNHAFDLHSTKGFNDHHDFTANDFAAYSDEYPLLMTEKDAVKCDTFAKMHWWYVPVNAQMDEQDSEALMQSIKRSLLDYN